MELPQVNYSSINWSRLFLESAIMGIIVVVLGYIIGYITGPWLGVSLPEACASWNKNYMMEINLFLIGFVGHMGFELAGMNMWYCKHGHACSM